MRTRTLALAITLAALHAPAAAALTGHAHAHAAGLPAPRLGGYPHRMPLPHHVTIHRTPNPACNSDCANPITGDIWTGPHPDRQEISHELGHVFWQQNATPADRDAFTHQLGLEPRAWYGTPADYQLRSGYGVPTELAAQAYATCDLGLSPAPQPIRRHGRIIGWKGHWMIAYGYNPTAREHRHDCATIRAIGTRHA